MITNPITVINDFQNKHILISEKIMNGNFDNDPYTYIVENKEAHEEYLLFVLHGIGQNPEKLNRILKTKIGPNIEHLFKYNSGSKKSSVLNKQVHIRMIDWKSDLESKTKKHFEQLLDKNNETKYPKMFIQQVPLDVLHYLCENKYEIHLDVVNQMNTYYDCVRKYRPLFRGNASIVGHSMGSIIVYDILKEMTFERKLSFDYKDNLDFANENNNTSDFGNSNNNNSSVINNNPNRKKFTTIESELKKENSIIKENEDNKILYTMNRRNRTDTFKKLKEKLKINNFDENEIFHMKGSNDDNNMNSSKLNNCTENIISESFIQNNTKDNKKIYSKSKHIKPLEFCVDHFFLIGSPLSLFLTVSQRDEACIEQMETIKDFHNIIHPMDPVSYRIEPLIENFPECTNSFTLPHYVNDGRRNLFLDRLFETLCMRERKKEEDEGYLNHDKKLGRKRYDFIVQENANEKAVHVIGFLFSHQAYWNNPDVFYFIIKMIHWQGYNSAFKKGPEYIIQN